MQEAAHGGGLFLCVIRVDLSFFILTFIVSGIIFCIFKDKVVN